MKVNEIYSCKACGAMLEVLSAGGGTPICCGQEMVLVQPNTVEASQEKHLPVIEVTSEGVIVKVGSVAHPMEEKHYITWIEVIADGRVYRQNLQPGSKPEAFFPVKTEKMVVREFCNLHGVWQTEI